MKFRDDKLNDIINWSKQNNDVRAVLLTSSLVNPYAPVDDFSDLDIEIIFDDNAFYVADSGWIKLFGEPIAMVEEDESYFDEKHAMKMVLYDDHVKVDFKLISKAKFLLEVQLGELPEDWDIGYKVLLDKDGITNNMKTPTYQVAFVTKPNREKFKQVLNDFWWDTTYVAKCLARDEIFYAKFMSENNIRTDYLTPLIEWYLCSQNKWNVSTNKHGRLFKKHIDADLWSIIEHTFSGSDLQDNWNALFSMADLVSKIGSDLALKLDYEYPFSLEAKVRKYLIDVRSRT